MKKTLVVSSLLLALNAPTFAAGAYDSLTGSDWDRELGELNLQAQRISRDELPALEKRAKGGDARAQTLLGMIYEEGVRHHREPMIAPYYRGGQYVHTEQFVERSSPKAIRWYRAAEAQGYMVARNNLGQMMCEGRGFAHDCAPALPLFTSAADAGYRPAQLNLAQMYLVGLGVPVNVDEAQRWMKKAMTGER